MGQLGYIFQLLRILCFLKREASDLTKNILLKTKGGEENVISKPRSIVYHFIPNSVVLDTLWHRGPLIKVKKKVFFNSVDKLRSVYILTWDLPMTSNMCCAVKGDKEGYGGCGFAGCPQKVTAGKGWAFLCRPEKLVFSVHPESAGWGPDQPARGS